MLTNDYFVKIKCFILRVFIKHSFTFFIRLLPVSRLYKHHYPSAHGSLFIFIRICWLCSVSELLRHWLSFRFFRNKFSYSPEQILFKAEFIAVLRLKSSELMGQGIGTHLIIAGIDFLL